MSHEWDCDCVRCRRDWHEWIDEAALHTPERDDDLRDRDDATMESRTEASE
jgi:hypothetical protein